LLRWQRRNEWASGISCYPWSMLDRKSKYFRIQPIFLLILHYFLTMDLLLQYFVRIFLKDS
jgi:hypothetical protein